MSDTDGAPEQEPNPQTFLDMGSQEIQFDEEAARKLIYKQAYLESCFAVTGKAPDDEPPDEETYKKQFMEFLTKNRDRVHAEVCVKLDWCGFQKKHKPWLIPIPMILALSLFFADLAAGGLATATWASTKGMLDWFCECEGKT